ncbi:MAG: DNA-directed RNA polymerase subunit delta [Bacilli bacterium]
MKKGIDTYKKEELELLSYKDITKIILEETPNLNTAELFGKIKSLLDLSDKEYENKIGDYYTSLATDKNFIMLDDGTWDLSKRHKSQKIDLDDADDEDDFEETEEIEKEDDNNFSYDTIDEDNYDDTDDDLKDLVIVDEDEIENE